MKKRKKLETDAPPIGDRLLTLREAADVLRLSTRTMREYVQRGEICNQLRYASEGGALVHRGRGAIARMFEATFGRPRSDRPEPWFPLVFTSPEEAAEAGLASLR